MYGGSAGSRTQVQKAFNPDHYLSILFMVPIPRTMFNPFTMAIRHQASCLIESVETTLTKHISFLSLLNIFFVHNNHSMVAIPRMSTNTDATSIRSRVLRYQTRLRATQSLSDCHVDFCLNRSQVLCKFFIWGLVISELTTTILELYQEELSLVLLG